MELQRLNGHAFPLTILYLVVHVYMHEEAQTSLSDLLRIGTEPSDQTPQMAETG